MLISANNVETMKAKTTELKNALSEISVAAYQSAAAADQPQLLLRVLRNQLVVMFLRTKAIPIKISIKTLLSQIRIQPILVQSLDLL